MPAGVNRNTPPRRPGMFSGDLNAEPQNLPAASGEIGGDWEKFGVSCRVPNFDVVPTFKKNDHFSEVQGSMLLTGTAMCRLLQATCRIVVVPIRQRGTGAPPAACFGPMSS